MKLIYLNIWGAKLYEPFIEFVKKHSSEIDVFCFQEVFSTNTDKKISNGIRTNIFQELERVLSEYQGYFASTQDNVDIRGPVDFANSFGLAIFIKKSIKVEECDDVFVHGRRNGQTIGAQTMGRNLQYITFNSNNKKYTIANFHGIWTGQGKGDTDERIKQSESIKKFLDGIENDTVLGGDFNLLPNTQSLEIVREGRRDLIEKYNITSTRSGYYDRSEKMADYVFASPGIKINDFKVLPDEVSDHLALYLDFE